ncbi:MAG: ATP-binding protein, partial [Chloroflexota bacterium]
THERLERLTIELDRARQLAENARALKARFAAYISHELRTPLNLIIGFSEMLLLAPDSYGGEVLPPAYRGDVNSIYQSARHLATLINDVLDLSQIDAHRMALERDDVTVAEIVREAVATVEAAFAEKGLTIDLDVPDGLPPLYVDRTRIRQVLINLLGNALRYTDQGGVRVRAALQSGEIVVAVADTGSGIPASELPRLFEDFRQAEQPEDQRPGGSGLGLAIARRFVALHGGWMRAASGPGPGTTVSFGLPVDRGAAPLDGTAGWETLERPIVVAGALPRIGVVSEDPWLTRLAQRYLDGYRVVPMKGDADSPLGRARAEVSALLAATPSDAEGWARLERAIAGGERLPVICCSLRGGREAIDRLGVQDYLDKPIARERLAEVLARWRPGRKTRTVLVVDDNHEVVRLLSRMIHLISRRFRVARAYGGEEALAMLRQSPPDLLLLDLLMPDVNGYDVLEAMRQDAALKDVPVVVISAKGMEDDAVVAGMFGLARADGFHAGEFMRCLQSALDSLLPSAQPVATTAESA